jgi:hypothetical protein
LLTSILVSCIGEIGIIPLPSSSYEQKIRRRLRVVIKGYSIHEPRVFKIVSTSSSRQVVLYLVITSAGLVNTAYEGSNTWIRDMFRMWTKSLLSVATDATSNAVISDVGTFNKNWVAHWEATDNYRLFMDVIDKELLVAHTPPKHAAAEMKTFFDELEDAVGSGVSRYGRASSLTHK